MKGKTIRTAHQRFARVLLRAAELDDLASEFIYTLLQRLAEFSSLIDKFCCSGEQARWQS